MKKIKLNILAVLTLFITSSVIVSCTSDDNQSFTNPTENSTYNLQNKSANNSSRPKLDDFEYLGLNHNIMLDNIYNELLVIGNGVYDKKFDVKPLLIHQLQNSSVISIEELPQSISAADEVSDYLKDNPTLNDVNAYIYDLNVSIAVKNYLIKLNSIITQFDVEIGEEISSLESDIENNYRLTDKELTSQP